MSDKLRERVNKQAEKSVQKGNDQLETTGLFQECGILTEFQADVLKPNISGITTIPIQETPTVIASLAGDRALYIDDVTDRVWLTAVLGWQAVTNAPGGKVDVLFKFYRESPDTDGEIIYSLRSSAEASENNFRSTTLIHVDLIPLSNYCARLVSYFLTAEIPLAGSAANIIGPITFTGAEFNKKRPPLHSCS